MSGAGLTKGGYRLVEDPQHGYLRVDPLPSEEEVARYYREEFYTAYRQFNDSSLQVQQSQKEFFDWRWADILAVARDHFGPRLEAGGLSALDIGCGFCQALIYLKERGLRVTGLELSPEAVEYGRQRGVEVLLGGVGDLAGLGRRFDLVLAVDVLEHLRDPATALLDIRRHLLNPGGLLVVDVPNDFNPFQVAADEIHHLGQWWVVPPNHLNYFSVESLERLVEACGLAVTRRETSFPLELFLLMDEVYVGDADLGARCHARRVAFERNLRRSGRERLLRRFYQALADIGLGRQIVLYATPKP